MNDVNIAVRHKVQHVVVMGVSGCGKTTVAQALSEQLAAQFGEADRLHPQANVDKMTTGHPLDDEDRWPWLDLVADWMDQQSRAGHLPIVSCSALKRRYRDRLRDRLGEIAFVHLAGPRATILRRMQDRTGHFMPAALLDSQFADLEPLQEDEFGVTVDVTLPGQAVVERARCWLTAGTGDATIG